MREGATHAVHEQQQSDDGKERVLHVVARMREQTVDGRVRDAAEHGKRTKRLREMEIYPT